MARKSKAKFTMKGHTLPGINQKSDVNLKDGRSPSSAFQQSALKTKEDLQHLREMEHDEEGNHLGRYDRKKEMDKSPLEQTENPLTGYDAEYLASLSPKERKQLRKENVEKLMGLSNKEINELVDYETDTYNLGNKKTYYNPYGSKMVSPVIKTPKTGIFSNLTKKQRKKKEAYLRTMARKSRADLSTGAMTREQMQEFRDAGIDPTTMGNE